MMIGSSQDNSNIKSILFNSQDDNLKNININDKIVDEYVDNLCSFGIVKLNEQNRILEKEENDWVSSIKQVIIKNYDSIINSSSFINDLDKDIQNLQTNINCLNETLPIFSEKVNFFSQEAESISKRWRNASLMLNRHFKILEILEILQLFDSCIRNSLYDEALKLMDYIEKLNQKHGKSVKIISDLGSKINEWKDIMVNQLMKELYTNNSYKTAINYLKKLDVFEESEIRLKFLITKNYKILTAIKEINIQSKMEFLINLINIYESNILEIFDQYYFLFNNDNNLHSKEKKYYIDFNEGSILISWIILKINCFLQTFNLNITELSNENFTFFEITSLFNPCFKFSASLSKIGLDLKFIFISIFNDYLVNDVRKNLNESVKKFESNLDNYNIVITDKDINEKTDSISKFIPPVSLKKILPLKILCNDILTQLNKVLLFISFNSIIQIKFILEENLIKTSLMIEKYLRSENSNLKSNEKEVLIVFKDQYEKYLLPHIQKCFEEIVLNLDETETFGLSSYNFTKLEYDDKVINLTKLNLPPLIIFNI